MSTESSINIEACSLFPRKEEDRLEKVSKNDLHVIIRINKLLDKYKIIFIILEPQH